MSGQWNVTIDQGATFDVTLLWRDETGTPVDLSGYTARAQIRSQVTSATPLVDLTDGDGITLGGGAGTIQLVISDTDTSALPAPFDGVWDLELESGTGTVTRLLAGTVTVTPEVTR